MTKTLLLILMTACVPPQPGVGAPQSQPQVAAAPAGKTCVQIVECLTTCAQDQSCLSTCVAAGDRQARQAVTALLECNAANAGPCDAEMRTCSQTVAAAQPAEDPRQLHTTANILPWLVGQWTTPNHQFTFWEDGRVRRASGVAMTTRTGDHNCVSTINEIGTVTQEGDLLVMVFPSSDGNMCGTKESTAGLTVRYRIDWFENPYGDNPSMLDLRLIDIGCTRGEMYCIDRMRRR